MSHCKHSRASLIRAIKRYAKAVCGNVTLAGFCRAERITTQPVYVCFPQGYWSLLRAAGLEGRGGRVPRVTREDLLREFDRVAREIGGMPERGQLSRMARYSLSAYQSHLGQWEETVKAYRRWKEGVSRGVERFGAAEQGEVIGENAARSRGGVTKVRKRGEEEGETVGAPLGFRGLVHAPTSELGVVHLFGLLGPELGIGVERIGARFPDCRGVRRDESGRWRRVAIEFEFKSSHFRMHRHDAEKCDLIVCWEHDWPECPVEVMELRAKVGGELR